MEYEGLILEKDEGIATVTLNRPEKLNALTVAMAQYVLPELWEELRRDDSVRVVIITGSGRAFCVGADLSEGKVGSGLASYVSERWKRLSPVGDSIIPLQKLAKPTIAAINGVTAGMGISHCLACDIRIASTDARFTLAFVNKTIVPDYGSTYLLPRIVGISKALELMLTGDMIDAREAERIGLVNRVVPHDDLMKVTRELARKLAKGPPITLGLIKRAVQEGIINDLELQIYFENYAQSICVKTKDFKEGVQAFIEKREPKFIGE